MAKAELGAGDVDIDLDGKTVTLRYTLAADQALSRAFDGALAAAKSVQNFNIDAIVGVIAIGSGMKQSEILPIVWRIGKGEFVAPLLTYLTGFIQPPTIGGEEDGDPQMGKA
jgi:hypothetical protein